MNHADGPETPDMAPGAKDSSLVLALGSQSARSFSRLLQQGVWVEVFPHFHLMDFLTKLFDLNAHYLEKRIQTVLLDGKAVDDFTSVGVDPGCTLSLSAAMPGLAGATLRKGGRYASLRQAISFEPGRQAGNAPSAQGLIRIKLFNLLLAELGPRLLRRGVWMEGNSLGDFFRGLPEDFWKACKMSLDGKDVDRFQAMGATKGERRIFLRVTPE